MTRKNFVFGGLVFLVLVLSLHFSTCIPEPRAEVEKGAAESVSSNIKLPPPDKKGTISVEEAINNRRTYRKFGPGSVTLNLLSQLFWSAQGVTSPAGFRTAPSAGALYPLEVYAVVGDVDGVEAGVYHYIAPTHSMERVKKGDFRKALGIAALMQLWIKDAPVSIVITGDYERTKKKYKDRGTQFVHIEVGHAAQIILLQAQALGLVVGEVGAFFDAGVAQTLSLPEELTPFLILPVGKPPK